MLVLEAKLDGKIKIGDDITIQVVGVRRKQSGVFVRLGFTAPKSIPIHREEVAERIRWAAMAESVVEE